MNRTTVGAVVFATLMIGMIFNPVWAQKGKEKGNSGSPKASVDTLKFDNSDSEFKRYRKIYDRAIGYNDFAVATEAMYQMMSLKPQQSSLMDTLAALYFQRGAWPQVVLVTTEILEANGTNQGALELRAVANQSIGRAKESLEDYEALYKQTKSPYHLYEIAALQFSMKRFGECELTLRNLLGDQEIKDKTISITVQDGRSQDVPLPAAALNLNGVLDLEQGKKESAKTFFEAAIKIFPEFILAKNNLDALAAMK